MPAILDKLLRIGEGKILRQLEGISKAVNAIEDDFVAENFVAHGTHRATLMGETPTGRDVVLQGVNIFRIADGKIVERWGLLDQAGLLQQIGLAQ